MVLYRVVLRNHDTTKQTKNAIKDVDSVKFLYECMKITRYYCDIYKREMLILDRKRHVFLYHHKKYLFQTKSTANHPVPFEVLMIVINAKSGADAISINQDVHVFCPNKTIAQIGFYTQRTFETCKGMHLVMMLRSQPLHLWQRALRLRRFVLLE